MSAHKNTRSTARILSPEQGRRLPAYDLLGSVQQSQLQLRELNGLRPVLARQVDGIFSNLFNGHGGGVQFSEFAQGQPAGFRFQAASSFPVWVLAETDASGWPPAVLCLDAVWAYRLAVLFFGGILLPSDKEPMARLLTEAEQRLVIRLFQHQLDSLCALAGHPELTWRLRLVTEESLPREGEWLHSRVEARLQESIAQWQLWFPVWQRPLPAASSDAMLASALLEQLPRVPVRLRVVLAELELSFARLSTLQVGDVLPVELLELAVGLVGQQSYLKGRVAEHNDGLVYQVTQLLDE